MLKQKSCWILAINMINSSKFTLVSLLNYYAGLLRFGMGRLVGTSIYKEIIQMIKTKNYARGRIENRIVAETYNSSRETKIP
jgi:hypothetical protein